MMRMGPSIQRLSSPCNPLNPYGLQISVRALGLISAVIVVVFLSTCPAGVAADSVASGKAVEVQMRNIRYHFTDTILVHIRRLHGHLVPRGELPVFDDKNSFQLQIDSAEIAMPLQSLANVLNGYVFAKSDAPLKSITVRPAANGRLVIKGKLHRKGDVSFESDGSLSLTADGRIRLHIDKVKALHLPVKGLMDLLGVEISDLVSTGRVSGVEAEKDDLILDPETLLPPPHIAGRITEVRIDGDNIVQVFGKPAMPMRVAAANYMAYRGNRLRFGKLTMNDTDMILIDMDPRDAFDFYLDHYKEQLVAGYTKETPAFGLRVYMRDYNKLSRAQAVASVRKPD